METLTKGTEKQRAYLQQLLQTGQVPPESDRPDFEDLEQAVQILEEIARESGKTRSLELTARMFAKQHPALATLFAEQEQGKPVDLNLNTPDIPPLPSEIYIAPEVGEGACRWLHEYEVFSRTWSPRGYKHFHTAVGIWLLSVIAARRVVIPLGDNYTPLFIALVAPTTQYAKSTTAKIAQKVLKAAGLSWLLAPDIMTPQKMMSNMAGSLPRGYGDMEPEEQVIAQLKYAFSGQIGWFYDEFGQHLDSMMQQNGAMSDFKGILRRMDDCADTASYDTITRGLEEIKKPYMALLASMTPADARPHAGRGAKFWRDGFFARFAFVTPPAASNDDSEARFPIGRMTVPMSLTQPLVKWHQRLGIPKVEFIQKTNKQGDVIETKVKRGELPENVCQVDEDVAKAFYDYLFALMRIVRDSQFEDLAGNYGRLPAKALRIAGLFASLENDGHIQMCYWAKAREITEVWRKCLHILYAQINMDDESLSDQAERKLLQIIERLTERFKIPPNVRDIRMYFKRYDSAILREKLNALVAVGTLIELREGKKSRYQIVND